MNAIGDQVDDIVSQSPAKIKVSDVIAKFKEKLASAIRSKDLTNKQAQTEIVGYLTDLTQQKITPTGEFVASDFRTLMQKINKDWAGIAKKIKNGTPLNPREKVIEALAPNPTALNPKIFRLASTCTPNISEAPTFTAIVSDEPSVTDEDLPT